jgi:hypothetical protein
MSFKTSGRPVVDDPARRSHRWLWCGEFRAQRLVYPGITDEMIDSTVAWVRELAAGQQRERAGQPSSADAGFGAVFAL